MKNTEKRTSQPEPPNLASSPLHQLVANYRTNHPGKLSPQDIVRILQEAIVRAICGPGRALRQDELAEVFGVSKIPVREAFRTLEAFGFVDLPHNRGAIVKELTAEQIRDVFELRLLIEPHLIRMSVPELTDTALADAEQLVEAMHRETNAWAWGELNVRFHRTLYEPAHRPLAMQFLGMLEGHVQRYSVMQLSLAGLNRTSNEDHREMLAACRRRDVDEAVCLTAEHVSEVKDIVIALYENHSLSQVVPLPKPGGRRTKDKAA
jgi:DNA-binding GntR family transcriptional regulator